MELQITNRSRIVDNVIKAIVIAFIISATIVSVRNLSVTKTTFDITTFTSDSSWVKGGWR